MISSSSSAAVHLLRLTIHCAMPRPPNRRRKARRLFKDSVDPRRPSSADSLSFSISTSDDPSNSLSAVIDLSALVSSTADAISDLRTLVSIDRDTRRLVISCRRSTFRFAGTALLLACLSALALRLLLFRRPRSASSTPALVRRRDRSLGGREVVVSAEPRPLAPPRGLPSAKQSSERVRSRWGRASTRLPQWWPPSQQPADSSYNSEAHQREADKLIRAITDNRMSGKDIVADDIIQLRLICRTSGVRVSFDTENTRDSLYRTAVDFVLNACGRAPSQSSSIQLAGEDIRQFIAGLAENVGLENIRASRIVSAAVAARTRSRFLQAWALEMQGKHAEAMLELSQICLTFRIFPPDESSAEMEMVGRGLEKHLKLEQREFLLDMLAGFCEEQTRRTAAEALGLMPSSTSVDDQL